MATYRDKASPRTARLTAALCGLAALFLVGCGTARAGATWWSPATWFSNSEATTSDKATARVNLDEKRVVDSESKTIIAARDETHRTAAVLSLAPQNAAVSMAVRTNGNAAAMLDEVKGPPTADSLRKIDEWAAKVLSNAPAADAEQKAVESRNSTTSNDLREARENLDQARAALAAAQTELREAFDRENALANQLRNEHLIKWGCAALAVLGLLGWLYLKIATGGLITGVGTALADLKGTADASTYKAAVNALDVNLTPALQAKIAAAKLKATFTAAATSST